MAARIASLSLLLFAACNVVAADQLGRACDSEHACSAGSACFCGTCVSCEGAACEPCALNAAPLRWWWPLDTAPSQRAVDCSGRRRAGQVSSSAGDSVEVVDAGFGGAWRLRTGQLATGETLLTRSGAGTLSFFAGLLDAGTPQALYQETSAGRAVSVSAQRRGALVEVVVSSGASVLRATSDAGTAFHHLAFTRDGGSVALWVDGAAAGALEVPAFDDSTAAWLPDLGHSEVLLDEVRGYDAVLEPSLLRRLGAGECSAASSPP